MFCKKGVLRNFTKLTGKQLFQSLIFNKVAGLRRATLLKKWLWHRCLPVNFVKFPRTPFLIEHLCWLLLVNFIKAIVKTWKKLKLELEFFKSARIFYKNTLSFCWYIVFKIFHWKNKSLLLKYITRNRCGKLQNTIRHEVNT